MLNKRSTSLRFIYLKGLGLGIQPTQYHDILNNQDSLINGQQNIHFSNIICHDSSHFMPYSFFFATFNANASK